MDEGISKPSSSLALGDHLRLPEIAPETGIISKWHNGFTYYVPARFILTTMIFFGLFLVYALRVGMSIALVAMVNQTALIANSTSGTECLANNSYNNSSIFINDTSPYQDGEFVWDESVQGLILSSFFYGYILTQIPGGRLAELFGAKWVFGLGVLLTGIMTLLVPLAAKGGPYAVVFVRSLAGLAEGVTYPTFYVLISMWFPEQEQNTHYALGGIGSIVGTIVILPTSAWLCEASFLGGWPLVFYVSGLLSCIWFLLWWLLVYSSPEEHPRISNSELSFILSGRNSVHRKHQISQIPVLKILTNKAVWALAIVKFSSCWLFYVMLTDLPTYLNSILHFSLDKNGGLNSLLYVAHGVTSIISGVAADQLRMRPNISLTFLRKGFQFVASFGSAMCLVFVTSMGCDWISSYVLLLFSCALLAISVGGAEPMNIDIAPNHAGTVGGLTNGFANMAGIFGPLLTGYIIKDNETLSAWGRVFLIAACVSFYGVTVFLFFGSAEVQPFSSETPHLCLQVEPADEMSDETSQVNPINSEDN